MTDDGLPTTTARAVAVAAVTGMLALAVSEPVALVGLLAGVLLAGTMRWFGRSLGRVTIAAAILPLLVLGTVAAIGAEADPITGVTTLTGVVVGVAVGFTGTGWPSSSVLERAGTAAMLSGFVAGAGWFLAFGIDSANGIKAALVTALWLTGHGVTGLVGWILVAGLAAGVGLYAVPLAAVTEPRYRDAAVAVRRGMALTIGFVVVVAVVLLSVATLVAWFLAPVESLLVWATRSAAVRGLVALVSAAGVSVAILGSIVQTSWHRTTVRENAIVGLAVGSTCAIVGSFVVGIGAGSSAGRVDIVAVLYGATAVGLVGTGLVLWWYAEYRKLDGVVCPTTVIAVGLGIGVGTVGAAGDAATGAAAVRAGVPALVALVAGLFVYDVGRYGRVLAREVGPDSAARLPQFVRLAWSGGKAFVGVPVAVVGLWVATVLAPPLSVPATVGVLAGVAAIVGGTWLLLR